MDVVVGPVDASSVRTFCDFGREVLRSQGPGADVPPDAASDFERFLDEWSAVAEAGGEVSWRGEAEPEVVEYLAYTFFRLASEVRGEAGGVQVVPDEGATFYWTLVRSLLDALEDEGGSRAEFAAHLREFWPGEPDLSS